MTLAKMRGKMLAEMLAKMLANTLAKTRGGTGANTGPPQRRRIRLEHRGPPCCSAAPASLALGSQ
jgi:hypothetical protein